MLDNISSRELSRWMSYSEVYPLRGENLEYMIAQLSSLTANLNGHKSKVQDFLPRVQKSNVLTVADKVKAIFGCQKQM